MVINVTDQNKAESDGRRVWLKIAGTGNTLTEKTNLSQDVKEVREQDL